MGFVLKDKSKEYAPLIFKVFIGGKTLKYYIGKTVKVSEWNGKGQRLEVKGVDKNSEYKNKAVNRFLNAVEDTYNEIISQCEILGIDITADYVRQELDKKYGKKDSIDKKIYLSDGLDMFYEDSKSGKRLTKKGTRISPNRLKSYMTLKNLMLELGSDKLLLSDVDISVYHKLVNFRNDGEKALNTIGGNLGVLKTALKYLNKIGLYSGDVYNHDDFKVVKETIEHVYTSDKEIDILYNADFIPSLARVVDRYIIGCYTGLRISDWNGLSATNIIGKRIIKVITEKTKDTVYIPLHYRVSEILKKYGGFPPSISEQKTRDYLKEACKQVGFDSDFMFKKTVGGVVKTFVRPKYELICPHTARRSFATNLYLAGFDTLSIMKITGHKTEADFMRYICVSQRQIADRMIEHPYFNAQ